MKVKFPKHCVEFSRSVKFQPVSILEKKKKKAVFLIKADEAIASQATFTIKLPLDCVSCGLYLAEITYKRRCKSSGNPM